MLQSLTCASAYLTLNLDVVRDELDISCYYVVPAAKQVLGECTGAVSDGPAGRISFSICKPCFQNQSYLCKQGHIWRKVSVFSCIEGH